MTRRPGFAHLVLALAVAILATGFVQWSRDVSPLRERGSDFSATYVAALLLRDGQGAALYDQGRERALHATLLPPGTHFTLPFITPPTTAAVALPLTALDPGAAYRVFSLVQVLLIAAASLIAVFAAPWPSSCRRPLKTVMAVAATAGGGTTVMLLLGQWDGLSAIGVALAYHEWRHDRGARAAAVLAVSGMAAKPHLLVGVAMFLVGRRRWREIAAAAVATLAMALIWLAITGPPGVAAYADTLRTTLSYTPPPSTMGLFGLATSLFGTAPAAQAGGLLLSVVALGACVALGVVSTREAPHRFDIALAAALVISLLATPHLLAHDVAVLAPAFAWMAGVAASRDEAAHRSWPGPMIIGITAAWGALRLITAADAGNGDVGFPGRLIAWGLIAAAAGLLLMLRRARGAPRREVLPA